MDNQTRQMGESPEAETSRVARTLMEQNREIIRLRQILGLLCIGLEQGKPLFGQQDLISCRHSKLAVEDALGYFKDKATGGE